MPCRWDEAGLTGFTGRVRFRRRFSYPGRIDPQERVWLTFEGVGGEAEIWLNGSLLGRRDESPVMSEFEVTRYLQARNELVVDLESSGDPPGTHAPRGCLLGEVALEVRCTAFLRGLHRSAVLTGDRVELRVSGQIVGVAERPLELYIVVDRSVAAYQVVTPTEEGQPFEVVVADLPAANWRRPDGQLSHPVVKVDLVNGATVWYTSAAEVTFEPLSGRGG